MGAGEAIVTPSGLRRDRRRARTRAPATRRRSSRSSRSPAVGSGDAFLAGYVARPLRGRSPRRAASPTASPAAPSRRSTSAPGRSTRARSSACVDRVEVSELDAPAARRLSGSARRRLSRSFRRIGAPPGRRRGLLQSPFCIPGTRARENQQLEVEIGRGKKARRAYGFDDIAIVPSRRTRDPDDIDITWNARSVPLRAAAARLGDGRRRQPRRPRR